MSFIGDSRKPRGPGILPLQDHGYKGRGFLEHMRTCLLGVRVKDIRVDAGELGHLEIEEVGDITGGFLLKKSSRSSPMWRFGPFVTMFTKRDAGNVAEAPTTSAGGASTGDAGGASTPGASTATGDIPAGSRPPGGGSDRQSYADFVAGLLRGSGAGGVARTVGSYVGSNPSGSSAASQTALGSSAASGPRPSPISSQTSAQASPPLRAIYGSDWSMDGSLEAAQFPGPAKWESAPCWPAFPGGFIGIFSTGTKTDSEERLWVPTDPRLIAANRSAPECGSLVFDLDRGNVDPERGASLQSFFRVAKGVGGGGKLSLAGAASNAIAWNLGTSGSRDVLGGLAFDGVSLGRVGAADGGFMDCGGANDKHRLGTDADGHQVNPAHLPILSFFRGSRSAFDGPMEFQQRGYPNPPEYPYICRTHLVYDSRKSYRWPQFDPKITDAGVWRWYTEIPFGTTNPTTIVTTGGGDLPPTGGPGTPGGEDPPGPTTPGGGGGTPTTGGGDTDDPPPETPPPPPPPAPAPQPQPPGIPHPGWPFRNDPGDDFGNGSGGLGTRPGEGPNYQYTITLGSSDLAERPSMATHRETGFTSTIAKAFRVANGQPNLPYIESPNQDTAQAFMREAPAALRTTAFAKQTVAGFDYTQRPEASRYPGGTASGGLIDLPPEVCIEDIANGTDPAGVTQSTASRIIGPGVLLGFGRPSLETGRVYAGWEFEQDGDDLIVYRVTSGAQTEVMRVTPSGVSLSPDPTLKFGVFGSTAVDQRGAISDPAGGGTIDSEARTAIGSILAAMRDYGWIAT